MCEACFISRMHLGCSHLSRESGVEGILRHLLRGKNKKGGGLGDELVGVQNRMSGAKKHRPRVRGPARAVAHIP